MKTGAHLLRHATILTCVIFVVCSILDFIQTREVRAEPGRTLQLLSPSSAMTLRGGSGLNVLASGSGISLTSPSSIQFNAGMGNVGLHIVLQPCTCLHGI